MASFLDTHGIASALNQAIAKTEKHILFCFPLISVSPYSF
jgi:hypothetical protein